MTDTSRKLLRILWSIYNSRSIKPDLKRLARLAQRDVGQIKTALQLLAKEKFIQWDPRTGIVQVLRPFEVQPSNYKMPSRGE